MGDTNNQQVQELEQWKASFTGPNAPYKVSQKNGNWYLQSGDVEKYIYVDKNGDLQFVSAEDYVNKILIDYKTPSNLESLRTSLYKKGFLSKTQFTTKDVIALNTAILEAGRSFSVATVQNFVQNPVIGNTKVTQLNSWLTSRPGVRTEGTDSGQGTVTYQTTKEEASRQLDEFFQDLLGEGATDVEKENYYNLLIAEQKKAKVTTTVDAAGNKVVTGTPLDEMDLYRIRAKVLKTRLDGTPLENLTKGDGRIVRDVNDLKEYAASYGVKLDTKQAYDQVVAGLKPGGALTTGRLDEQKQNIKNMAKAFYTNLSGLIDSGVKPSDIANQFAYYKGQLLESPDNAFNIFDEDIQSAMRNNGKEGVMSINEYQTLLRTNPKTKQKWLQSKGAKEEASNYALDILRSFGLMA